MPVDKLITVQQKKILWSIWKSGIGLSDADLYALIKSETKKEHMSDMSYFEAEMLIHTIRQKASGSLQGATSAQVYKIKEMVTAWNWTNQGTRKFIRKITRGRVELIMDLQPAEARNVLAALENIRKYNERKKAANGSKTKG